MLTLSMAITLSKSRWQQTISRPKPGSADIRGIPSDCDVCRKLSVKFPHARSRSCWQRCSTA